MITHELRAPSVTPPGWWCWDVSEGSLVFEDAAGTREFVSAGPRVVAENIEGMGSAKVDVYSREAARLPGRVRTGTRAKEREAFMALVFEALGTDWLALQRRFWSMFGPDQLTYWRVYAPDGSWRELPFYLDPDDMAYPQDPSVIRQVFGFAMVSDSVFWLGPEQVIATAQDVPPVNFYGPTNVAPPFYIMPGQGAGQSSFTFEGDVDAWAVFTAYLVTGFTITDGSNLLAGSIDAPYTWTLDTDPTARVLTGVLGSQVRNATDRMTSRQYFPIRTGVPVSLAVDASSASGWGRLSYRPKYWRAF